MGNKEKCVKTNYQKNINAAVNSSLTNIIKDVTIISGENDMIQTNKILLSLFSATLAPLLSSPCCNSPTIFLPDGSTFYIIHVINIITNGFTVSDDFSDSDRENIFETGKLLNIDLKYLMICLLYTSPSPRD